VFIKDYKSLHRAKGIVDAEWIEGFYCRVGYTGDEKDYIIPSYASAFYGIEIDAKTLCKSFMYSDDTGKVIYDKDIVEFQNESEHPIIERYLIQWVDEGQEFQAIPLHKDDALIGSVETYFHSSKCEPCDFINFIPMLQDVYGDFRPEYGGHTCIIGNAFDNPELLNTKFGEQQLMKTQKKIDMSDTCGEGQQVAISIMDEESYCEWYKEHCANCIYEHEICMYGED